MTEFSGNPLQTIVAEFKYISPETTYALIFKNTGEITANMQVEAKNQSRKLITGFDGIAQNAKAIGGVENLSIQAEHNQLNITAMDSFYLATVSSKAAKPEVVKSLTHVIVPTVARLVNQTSAESAQCEPLKDTRAEIEKADQLLKPKEEPVAEVSPEPQPVFESLPPKAPINQFMVEKVSGLLVVADTVRIDPEIISQWSLYSGRQITMVNIEALDGKKTTCKFKPIKESKSNNKGIIQMPEKIIQALNTEKGKLVMVQPVIG